MRITEEKQITSTLEKLFNDAKNDGWKIMKGATKNIFRSIQPEDFKDAYLSISKVQGDDLIKIIVQNELKNIVEFGTSFGISTLFLAQGARLTDGTIITTELIPSKADKAKENFKSAGVEDIIEVRIGDAMKTLERHNQPIDLLLLDGWKDLYAPLFHMLKPNFHKNTIVYVDNANMHESRLFLETIELDPAYEVSYLYGGKVSIIKLR